MIIHPCDWTSAPFGSLRATPLDGKPVSMFANQAEALTQIAKDIRSIVEEMGCSAMGQDEKVEGMLPDIVLPQDSPRSSNLRVKKKFTDREVDDYLESSFEYMARFFEASLEELQSRNTNITAKFKRVDTNSFTASIYDEGNRASECTVWTGSDHSFVGGIAYYGESTNSRNQYNESLSVENDGYSLNLRPMGMSHFGINENQGLSQEGGAELFWELLIK